MWYGDEGVEEDIFDTPKLKQRKSLSNLVAPTIEPTAATNNFQTKVKDRCSGLALFGTVPPPSKFSSDQAENFARGLAESISHIAPDAVMIYDIQDEPSRNGTQRPFPFFNTHEPRAYASLLEKSNPGLETIVYRAMIPGQTMEQFNSWLRETIEEYKTKHMVVVGGSSMYNQPLIPVMEATKLIKDNHPQVLLGGIIIPERHRDRGNEHIRIIEKCDSGIGFYTSQVVYNADNAIALLRDYDELCKEQHKEPTRIVFTFAPFGSDATVQFLKCLGVELPEGTVKRVLSRPTLKARVEESIQICWENWKRILDASKRLKLCVPIGFSVESVSKSKMEQELAYELFNTLREEMEEYYVSKRKQQLLSSSK